jgi:hypothetical protein
VFSLKLEKRNSYRMVFILPEVLIENSTLTVYLPRYMTRGKWGRGGDSATSFRFRRACLISAPLRSILLM